MNHIGVFALKNCLYTLHLMFFFVFFFFPWLKKKTRAYHRLTDDVPDDVKARRHSELMDTFRKIALKLNTEHIGQIQLVLIQGVSVKDLRVLLFEILKTIFALVVSTIQ